MLIEKGRATSDDSEPVRKHYKLRCTEAKAAVGGVE